jgi:hypothetical protein
MDDNPSAIRPRKRSAARAGIAVLALTIVGGGIAIGMSIGGSPSPVHPPAAASAQTHNRATATTTTVGPKTSTTTGPEKVGAPGAITEPTTPNESTTATTKQTKPVTPTPTSIKPTTTTTPTTTATAAPAGGNCTSPIFSSSEAQGTENTDPGDGNEYWWVDNDAWSGGAGPQTLNVCSQSSWNAVSNQPNVGGQVETYPNTEYDIGGRAGSYPSTVPLSAYSSITSTFSEDFPTTGDSFDAAYDLWTDNWTNETMIWNQYGGTQDYWVQCAEPGADQNDCGDYVGAVTLAGASYHVLNLGGEVIFVRDVQVSSGSVDILGAYDYEIAQGLAKATDAPTQLEYGVEIVSTTGTQTFPLTGVTFSLAS